MTVERLAATAGMHWTYLSGIERGVRNPTWQILISIAHGLEIRISELARSAEDLAESIEAGRR